MSEPTKKQLQAELAEVNREWEKSQERTRVAEIRTAELLIDRDFSKTTAWCLVAVTVLVGICGVVNVIETQHSRDAVIAAMPKATTAQTVCTTPNTDGSSICGTVAAADRLQVIGTEPVPVSPSHDIGIQVTEGKCWISGRMLEGNGAGFPFEGMYSYKQGPIFDLDEGPQGWMIEIHSGCPGKLKYVVDGVEVHPANLSKSSKTETVRLPQ